LRRLQTLRSPLSDSPYCSHSVQIGTAHTCSYSSSRSIVCHIWLPPVPDPLPLRTNICHRLDRPP
jgi:hypothetical protein